MKNFIRYNIQNVKGTRKPSSFLQQQPRNLSVQKTKPKYVSNPHRSIENRVRNLQHELTHVGRKNDSLILQEISQIRRDIKLIKSHLFGHKHSKLRRHSEEKEEEFQEQQTVYTLAKQARMKSYGSENEDHKQTFQTNSPPKRIYRVEEIIDQKMKKSGSGYSKSNIHIKNIYHMLRQYKLDGPQYGTIFFGYAKRNSQPVAIKYSEYKLDQIIEIYDRLWKNIAKAQWPCVNRIYDFKSDDFNIIVMEKNKSNIVGLPYKSILVDLVKILQFIHDCGYLYRNIQPEHLMLNEEGQLVMIDFKRAKRYVDIKGHQIQVFDTIYTGSPFASNNQVRGLAESRKDDLQSVGYLALLLLEMEIPWGGMNKEQVIKIRSSLTLQELYRKEPNWMEFMAYVMRLPKNERPDYKYLCKLISH